MYFDHFKTLAWAREIKQICAAAPQLEKGETEILILPSFPSLPALAELFADTPIKLGAQNMAHEEFGALTGEVSVHSLKQIGCSYIEIGHAERRRYFGETVSDIQKKIALTLENGLTPLVCVGEDRQVPVNEAAQICIDFIEAATEKIDPQQTHRIVFAYEPEWAIGAAEPASTDHVCGVTRLLRDWFATRPELAQSTIIYGGSAGPGLLTALKGSADGLFLGRFAHDPTNFERILSET